MLLWLPIWFDCGGTGLIRSVEYQAEALMSILGLNKLNIEIPDEEEVDDDEDQDHVEDKIDLYST